MSAANSGYGGKVGKLQSRDISFISLGVKRYAQFPVGKCSKAYGCGA